jgi:hypothetical protein
MTDFPGSFIFASSPAKHAEPNIHGCNLSEKTEINVRVKLRGMKQRRKDLMPVLHSRVKQPI